MKAVYLQQFGGPEVLIHGDLPDPAAGPGQVVVDVHVASVNAADWRAISGKYVSPGAEIRFPLILGRDFSGTVGAIGEGVDDFRVGDEVFGVLEAGRNGTYCEKLAIGAAIVAKKPPDVSHTVAAALALTGLTALSAIEDTLRLQPGETVLVQGGAGGVASVAIQIAKHIGARVVTTASAGNMAWLRELGAEEVIDYGATDFTKAVRDCDAVLDTVGGEVANRSLEVLKPGGRAAFIGGLPTEPTRGDVAILKPPVARARAPLERIVALHQAGVVRTPVVTDYPLSRAAEAVGVSAARHLRGKLVLKVR
ncbi:NADP-dependent oxidoreductase [Ramlibacter sp.]|uniref:NADP-dependent oxidoreductase n=1 Tax=Ramlibacter sp. TaxID=1917967 RepID=UPI003D0D53C6